MNFTELRQRLVRWFPLGGYSDPATRYRALSTYAVAVVLLVVSTIANVYLLLTDVLSSPPDWGSAALTLGSLLILDGLGFAGIWLTRTKRQVLGSLAILLILVASIAAGFQTNSGLNTFSILVLASLWLFLSLTGLLLGTGGLPIGLGVSLAGAAYAAIITNGTIPEGPLVFFIFIGVGLLMQASVVWLLARGQTETAQRANLTLTKRATFDQAAQAIAAHALTRVDLTSLLPEVMRLVRNTLPEIDLVQLWLMDDDRHNLSLAASTDRTDHLGRKVGVGSLDTIGRVAVEGRSSLVRDTPGEAAYRRSGLPLGLHSLFACPLKLDGSVMGILSLASEQVEAFANPELDAVQNVADQIALAVERVQMRSMQEGNAAEIRRLSDQVQSSQQTIARLNQEATTQAWRNYLQTRVGQQAFAIELPDGQAVPGSQETESLAAAQRTGKPVLHRASDGTASIVALPILVNDQAIGAMEFELDPGQTPSEAQLQVMQQVIERMAFAAENARLFEEAQELAQRERLVGVIGTKLQGTLSVESVLSTVAHSLVDSLGASRVAIRLSTSLNENGEA